MTMLDPDAAAVPSSFLSGCLSIRRSISGAPALRLFLTCQWPGWVSQHDQSECGHGTTNRVTAINCCLFCCSHLAWCSSWFVFCSSYRETLKERNCKGRTQGVWDATIQGDLCKSPKGGIEPCSRPLQCNSRYTADPLAVFYVGFWYLLHESETIPSRTLTPPCKHIRESFVFLLCIPSPRKAHGWGSLGDHSNVPMTRPHLQTLNL